jgi:hypothetical protein
MSGWLFTYAPLVALCVSILALSASFLSLGWSIYRDVVLKPRLKVAFGIKSMLREDEEHRLSEKGPPLLILEITNHGPGAKSYAAAPLLKLSPSHFSGRYSANFRTASLRRISNIRFVSVCPSG